MSATDDKRRASCRSLDCSGFLAARLFNPYRVGYYVGVALPVGGVSACAGSCPRLLSCSPSGWIPPYTNLSFRAARKHIRSSMSPWRKREMLVSP